MNGLSVCSIELTSRCNKNCWCCGRRQLEKEHPELCNWGDMPLDMVELIAKQLPWGIVVQMHNSGDPLIYPYLKTALSMFSRQIRCFNTNGKLLLEQADNIIDNMDTIAISVIENDQESEEQYRIVKEFLKIKGERKPRMIYRLLGDVSLQWENFHRSGYDEYRRTRWEKLPGLIATRCLHNSMGSFEYSRNPTIPEIGICLDLLSHLSIDRFGDIFTCVRMNPHKLNFLGNVKIQSIAEIWNSIERKELIRQHIDGRRDEIELCKKCQFFGCPTSY